jgi:hypothetical protein
MDVLRLQMPHAVKLNHNDRKNTKKSPGRDTGPSRPLSFSIIRKKRLSHPLFLIAVPF